MLAGVGTFSICSCIATSCSTDAKSHAIIIGPHCTGVRIELASSFCDCIYLVDSLSAFELDLSQ